LYGGAEEPVSHFDQHVHSHHSFDSSTPPEDNVRRALEIGLEGVTFTEHFDTHPNDWSSCIYAEEPYTGAIEDLRKRFGSRLFIGKGIEVCYQPERMGFILNHLAEHPFDLVILSIHYFRGQAVHGRKHWEGITIEEGTRCYLENVLDAARFCERLHRQRGRVFDVLGHLDLAKRYTQRFFGRYNIDEHEDLIDEILQTCLAADLIPEINTSTLRQNLDEPMPGQHTISRYACLGGRAMPLGSDAHLPQSIGADFDHAAAMLRTAGIHHTVLFRNRDRSIVPLSG
jgi:histidinol-phosphatase (PHP family)